MDIYDMYLNGNSIPEINKKTDIPLSTIRNRLKKAGVLRSRADGVKNAASKGLLSHAKGKSRTFTDEWKRNISKGKKRHGDIHANGVRIKSNGYAEFTREKYKGKLVHVVVMEKRIGRPLRRDECVHHIDGDKLNNEENNLCLMTISGHARLHRLMDKLSNNTRERKENGQFK